MQWKGIKIKFDVNIANSVAIDIANNGLFSEWRYAQTDLTNQNHCYMPKLNDSQIFNQCRAEWHIIAL